MDAVSLIIGALNQGISPDVRMQSMIPDDIYDRYDELIGLLAEKLADMPEGQKILEAYAAEPDMWAGPLEEVMREAGLDQDAEILDVAQGFMEDMDPHGATHGHYTVDIDDSTDQDFI